MLTPNTYKIDQPRSKLTIHIICLLFLWYLHQLHCRSGLGNHYGTLSGPVPAFSAQNKSAGAYKSPNKNFYTNPGKKGTGFGYLSVTLGQFPKHMTEPYDQVALNDKVTVIDTSNIITWDDRFNYLHFVFLIFNCAALCTY